MHISIVPILNAFKHSVNETQILLERNGADGNILMQLEQCLNDEVTRQLSQENTMKATPPKPEDLFIVNTDGSVDVKR